MKKSGIWAAALLGSFFVFATSAFSDGISGTGFAFRSIVIDGVHYETDGAVVRANGLETTIDELKVGHRIHATVDTDTLTATEIDQYDAVVGRIDAVTVFDETLSSYELQVMNQTVRTRIETVLHVEDKFKFKKGAHVAIGGIRDANDIIWATSVEVAEKKDVPVILGIVGEVGDYHFDIGGQRVTSPYHYEYVQEGWLVSGAAVQVIGGKVHDDVLEAETVHLVPAELVTLREGGVLETSQSWLEGAIEMLDPEASKIQVNGFEVHLEGEIIILDKRDEVRAFHVNMLQPADVVTVVVRKEGDRLVATKLVRKKKARPRLRAALQNWDDQEGVITVLDQAISVEQAKEIKFRGKKIKLQDLREHIGVQDGLLLEWDKHRELKKVRVISDSERWSEHRK